MRDLPDVKDVRAASPLNPRIVGLGFLFTLAVFYAVVAAAAFQGYYTKWTMSDGNAAQSLPAMLDGTAQRPYVYRQLLPQIATQLENALPDGLAKSAEERLVVANGALKAPSGGDTAKAGYAVRYRIVYFLTYLSLFAALFVLRSIILDAGLNRVAATLAPAAFALMVPLLQTRGGYFYDLPELLAFALAAKFAYRGWMIPLLLLAAPATANKEAFLFYAIALFPLMLNRMSWKKAVITTGGMVLIAGLTYLGVKSQYADNPGGSVIFQFFQVMKFYLNPLNLLKLESTYGLPLFKGYGIIVLGWFAILMTYGWREMPEKFRLHFFLAAAVNLPLFLLFCAEGELRNLSMLYVSIIVLMAGSAQRWIGSATRPLPA